MTKERFQELQTEIARLKEIDKQTSDRVAREFWERDMEALPTIAELEPGHPMYVEVPCSKELDMEWANESENIQ